MADPPLIPGLSPITPGPAAVGGQANPPLIQLPPGTQVSGFVSGFDAAGNPVIRTEALQLTLASHFPLLKGNQVVLRIEPPVTRNHQPDVRILMIDGKPPTANAGNPASPTATSNVPAATPPRPIGQLLEVIQRPLSADGSASTPAANRTASEALAAPVRGAAAQVTVSGTQLQAVLLRPSPLAAQAQPAPLVQPQEGGGKPLYPAQLQPGLQLQVRVVQVVPPAPLAVPSATTPPTAPPASTPTIPATTIPATAPATHETLPPQARAAYASYTRPAGGELPPPPSHASAPTPSSSAPPPLQAATPNSSAPPPLQAATPNSSAPPPLQAATPSSPSPPTAATPAAPQQAGVPESLSRALTMAQVGQLLAQAEAKPLPPGQVAVVVTGRDLSGAVTVESRMGSFVLPQLQAATTPPGTVMQWEIRAHTPPATPTPAGVTSPPPLPLTSAAGIVAKFSVQWPALDELLAALQGTQMGQAAIQRAIPNLSGNFTAGLLFFISVLRKGDIGGWLGSDTTSLLEKLGKGELVARIGADMAGLRAMFSEQQQPGGWQALFFPLLHEGALQQARLFIRREEEEKRKQGGSGTRFVVEVDLSQLGLLQLDGLVKKRESKTQFDLVVRSHAELEETIRHDIAAIFENAQQLTGFSGALYFRAEPQFPLNPLEDIRRAEENSNSIIA